MAITTKSKKGVGRKSSSPESTSDRAEFFGKPLTIFANRDASMTKVKQLQNQLCELSFEVELVESDQTAKIMIYHRGDVIFGARLNHFVKYATWLRKQPL